MTTSRLSAKLQRGINLVTKVHPELMDEHDYDHEHHDQGHDGHSHEHDHDDHGHDHREGSGIWGVLAGALHLPGYSHTHEQTAANDALFSSDLAVRTVRWAFVFLAATTLIQFVIYLSSGSVALLADTVHNLGDALNSLPLWIAFALIRRSANRRYTYGYGRAEDLAGVLIVASIVFSAGYIVWESVQKLINPQPLTHLGWVAAAALVGFVGNEAVALVQIRVGRQIGSEAMTADGQHARIDGLTSLAVLVAVAGTWLGFPIVDPIVGLLIGIVIVFITRDAAVAMWHRLMDAVDPAVVEKAVQVLGSHEEVRQVVRIQMRWVGHQLHASATLALDENLDLSASERITDHIRHHLLHEIPHLYDGLISVVPWRGVGAVYGEETGHHAGSR